MCRFEGEGGMTVNYIANGAVSRACANRPGRRGEVTLVSSIQP
jgi:hypothetical protein